MKKAIHPSYHNEVEIICACGKKFVSGSTISGPMRVDICSNCHPFFTGEKRLVDTEGRVERFTRQVTLAEDYKTKKEEHRQKKEARGKGGTKQKPLTLRELLQQTRGG